MLVSTFIAKIGCGNYENIIEAKIVAFTAYKNLLLNNNSAPISPMNGSTRGMLKLTNGMHGSNDIETSNTNRMNGNGPV